MRLPISSIGALILPTYVILYLKAASWIEYSEVDLLRNGTSMIEKDLMDFATVPEGFDGIVDDKDRIISLLQEAGVTDIDHATRRKLPSWNHITNTFGDSPRIVGLDQCQVFQNNTRPEDRLLGVAGNFNSGTNLLYKLLRLNCKVRKRKKPFKKEHNGVLGKVPWGKHAPVDFRGSNRAEDSDARIKINNVLSVVTIRDPYDWMKSMCRNGYSTSWNHSKGHCPNLVPLRQDRTRNKKNKTVRVKVQYPLQRRYHKSLAHFWSTWYTDYLKADFPRIMIRMEDLVFHTRNVTTQVCHCAGGQMRETFQYLVSSAKESHTANGTPSSLVDVMIRYAKDAERFSSMTREDLELARSALDPELMDAFGYQVAVQPQ